MTAKTALVLTSLAICALGASACSRDIEKMKREYVERGDRYIQDKNVEAAIIEYRNAVQHDPRFGEAYRKLASAYLTHGDGAEAVRAAVTAAELLPDVPEAQLEAGSLLLLAGKFADAKKLADKVLTANAQDVRARVLLGNATAGLKDLDSAIKEFEEAIRLDPQQSATYTGLASLKASSGDPVAAERIFKQAISTDPQSTSARLALAHFYWSHDRTAEAEQAMKEAHELKPNDSRVNVTLALFYQATRRRTEAEPFLRAAAEAGDDPRLTMLLADYYIAHNRGAEAAKLLQPLTGDRKYGVLVSMRLAGIAQVEGHADEAITIIDKAISSDPSNSRTLAAKSDLLLRQNRVDEAAKAADAAVAANASSAEAQFVRGRVLRAKGSFDKAEEAFNEVLRINPRAAAARVELARLRIRSGADDAVTVATEAAKADPRSLDARLTLARALMSKRDYAKAQEVLTAVVAAAPDVAAVHAQMGTLLTLKKDSAGARASFTRALELDPVQIEAAGGLSALDFAAGQRPAALARLDAMVTRAPRNAAVLVTAASAHAAAGSLDRAESLLMTAIDVDPASMPAYSLLGRIYLSQKRLDAARAQFEKVAARQERPVGPLTLIGTIHMLQNRTPDAQQTFERVMQLDSKAAVAANNLAWIYLENGGSLDVALHLAEVARAGMPNAAEVNDTVGWAYYKKGAMPEAISALRRSLEIDPKSASTLYHLALAYDTSGDRVEARRVMTLYLQVDPSSERSADVRKRLQALGT
jgi:tetratricopeptide (TPR) repeat protein